MSKKINSDFMGFYGGLMGFNMIYPLVMTFTVCDIENGPVEIVESFPATKYMGGFSRVFSDSLPEVLI